jgi:hypothetical protein
MVIYDIIFRKFRADQKCIPLASKKLKCSICPARTCSLKSRFSECFIEKMDIQNTACMGLLLCKILSISYKIQCRKYSLLGAIPK